jgi:hypothetical protein
MTTAVQELTLTVPGDYLLPTLLLDSSPEIVAQVLTLGAHAYDVMKQEGQRISHETLYQQLQQQAAATYEPKVKELAKLRESLETFKTKLAEEQERRLDTERRTREEERRNREELVKEKDARITKLEEQVKELTQSVRDSGRSIADQFQSFKEQMLKTTTGSKKKGDQGEFILDRILERVFGTGSNGEAFDLQNVGREGHQGDSRMHWKGFRFLIESKHYDRNVDTKEVTKFLRDMEENKDAQVGFMISLNTGITGHTKAGKVDLELLSDGRLCVYLSHFLQHEDPVLFFQSLRPFLEVYLQSVQTQPSSQQSDHSQEESRALRQLELFEQQRKVILKVLANHDDQVKKMRNTLVNAKKKHDQIWLEIMGEMRECEHRVKLLLETITDATLVEEADDQPSSKKHALPSYIFKHTDLALYNEKERKFIQDILKHFTFHEDHKMQTKEAKTVFLDLGYTEDALIALRARVFQDDVWERGKKELRYMNLASK